MVTFIHGIYTAVTCAHSIDAIQEVWLEQRNILLSLLPSSTEAQQHG